MSLSARRSLELRLLILAPTLRDATLTTEVLGREGIRCLICPELETLCARIEEGAGAAFLPEEAIGPDRPDCLLEVLARQPPWSDLPLLILSRHGADSAAVAQAMDLLGNVTVVERPTRMASLVSAVRSALRARQRQYQIREHLAERARAEEALREADWRKDEFLAILAHELRNPLAPIRNSLHILKATGAPGSRQQDIAGMMERQVNQMVRLVDDLLEVSRITRGKIELRKERIELAALVESAVETGRPLIEAAGHRLVVQLPAEPLVLEADPVRMAQVLSNLLNNAAKYTDPGGTIEIHGRRGEGEALLEVRDSGQGIPADMLPRVFELFTQLDGAVDRGQGGLGIGLTLARALVDLHGGRIEAYSEGRDRGSRFVVHLPLPATRPVIVPAEGAAAVPAPAPALPRRILVVDDNRDAADSLAMVLSLVPEDVRVAYDGHHALEIIRDWHPSVVFLDIGMAGIDGYEVARRVRAESSLDDVVLVALTGWGQEKDRRQSREAGINHHLTKPVHIGALHSLLASLEVPAGHSSRA
jgi:signal transduction histidine kinase/ActR/RegA family two-component response regulator